jgi:hypothetical protein
MSKAARLRSDFKIAVDHIRDRVVSNVVDAKKQGFYKIDDAELARLTRVIESAFEQGFITVSGQVEKSIEEVTR